MVVDLAKITKIAVVNMFFWKREELRVTYKSGERRTHVGYILAIQVNLERDQRLESCGWRQCCHIAEDGGVDDGSGGEQNKKDKGRAMSLSGHSAVQFLSVFLECLTLCQSLGSVQGGCVMCFFLLLYTFPVELLVLVSLL